MQFKVSKSKFVRALSAAFGAVDGASVLPILANVLVRATDKGITVTGTDLTVSTSVSVPAEVTGGGAGFTCGKRLLDVVKGLPGDEVAVVWDEDTRRVKIKAEKSAFEIVGLDADSFPLMPAVDGGALVGVGAATFAKLLDRTIYSASSDLTRAHLAGVFLESTGSEITAVSTDGHRMSKAVELLTGPRLEHGVIVPRKACAEIRKALEGLTEPVWIGVEEDRFAARAGDVEIVAKIVGAQFPPYEQVIPKDHKGRAAVDRQALLDAFRRVSLLAGKACGVKVSVLGSIKLECEDPEAGSASEEVARASGSGAVKIGLNAKYVGEALASIDSEQVVLKFGGDLDPVLVEPEDEGDEYTCVVMPMRL